MKHLVSTILVLGPWNFKLSLELPTWIPLNKYKHIDRIWSAPKRKDQQLGQKFALIGKTQTSQISHISCWIQTMIQLPIAMSQNHLWMHSSSLRMETSQIYQSSANWTAAVCFCWSAGRLHGVDCFFMFLLGFWIVHPNKNSDLIWLNGTMLLRMDLPWINPNHQSHLFFNMWNWSQYHWTEPVLFAQKCLGLFCLARAKNSGSG